VIYKVMLPLSEIPEGATVSKVTGQVEFTVRDTIALTVYNEAKTRQTITPHDGCRFLLGARGDISAYSGKTEFHWHATAEELYRYFEDVLEGTPQ
jgi:hypothetical protein